MVKACDGEGKLDAYLKNEPYVVERVWETIEIEPMNAAIVNGEFRK